MSSLQRRVENVGKLYGVRKARGDSPAAVVDKAVSGVKFLVEKGAQCDLIQAHWSREESTLPDNHFAVGQRFTPISPLLIACDLQRTDLVRLLVEKAGEDPNRKGKIKSTQAGPAVLPLEFALHNCSLSRKEDRWRHWKVVRTLIQVGACPGLLRGSSKGAVWLNNILKSPCCQGPLLEHIIICLHPSVICSMTLDPSPNVRTLSPLGAAVNANYTGGVRALVDAGVDVKTDSTPINRIIDLLFPREPPEAT
uniref:Uncharacterized protein n=1 Tax=Chromera velia CCMP2878 TaxID=1169474 RepID=A0A0G4FRP4_9ALVE|eukprot:Cvel_18431.t1-p1 / transcript=Cvel_18431.t1 / gene=Cvel_18431 / organism=Chromera_velia_CCMP2878 / gene_product=hypothetical protein / transcript_product=hypothetical protein / location=Cvel_scaffold1526:28994-31042(+) / protein_length=251 / sequence_SO=supercontig / SO=protein_coding / is_pseudo=false